MKYERRHKKRFDNVQLFFKRITYSFYVDKTKGVIEIFDEFNIMETLIFSIRYSIYRVFVLWFFSDYLFEIKFVKELQGYNKT